MRHFVFCQQVTSEGCQRQKRKGQNRQAQALIKWCTKVETLRRPDALEHFHPLIQGMDQPKNGQRTQPVTQARVGGAPALQRHHQPHAEKGQSVEKVDQDEREICHDPFMSVRKQPFLRGKRVHCKKQFFFAHTCPSEGMPGFTVSVQPNGQVWRAVPGKSQSREVAGFFGVFPRAPCCNRDYLESLPKNLVFVKTRQIF